jgi:hypothetical protein
MRYDEEDTCDCNRSNDRKTVMSRLARDKQGRRFVVVAIELELVKGCTSRVDNPWKQE